MTGRSLPARGSWMRWVLQLVETGTGSRTRIVDVMEISRPNDLGDIANLGLTLPEAKQVLARVQQAVVAAQARDHAVPRPDCSTCLGRCPVKDRRLHQVATLFGTVAMRLPRFRCTGCGRTETCINWPSHCRSTPELGQLRAHLSALMPFRVAAGVLTHLLPVEAGKSSETLRGHTLKVSEQFRNAAAVKPGAAASAITITLDSTFIRSRHDGERHLEVRVGNVETLNGGRRVFGAAARTDTDIAMLIQRSLEPVGRTADTELTAFIDGCPGLRSILADAGIIESTDSRLVPHRHATPAREASGERIVDRPARPSAGESRDRRRGRTPTPALLERQGQECPAQPRTDPQGHACLQGRTRPSHDGRDRRAISQAVACIA